MLGKKNVDKSSTTNFYQKKRLFLVNDIILPGICQKYTVSISRDTREDERRGLNNRWPCDTIDVTMAAGSMAGTGKDTQTELSHPPSELFHLVCYLLSSEIVRDGIEGFFRHPENPLSRIFGDEKREELRIHGLMETLSELSPNIIRQL